MQRTFGRGLLLEEIFHLQNVLTLTIKIAKNSFKGFFLRGLGARVCFW